MAEITIHWSRDLDSEGLRSIYELRVAVLERDAAYLHPDVVAAIRLGLISITDFAQGHINPNSRVGRSLNTGQEFMDARVVAAIENGQLLGYVYGANNVSGSKVQRMLKKRIKQPYLWGESIVVHPDHRREHLGLQMARVFVGSANPEQQVAVYPYASQLDARNTLLRFGFRETVTDVDALSALGPADHVRMTAKAGELLVKIDESLGANH